MARPDELDPHVTEQLKRLDASPESVGVIVIDHGSRRDESNRLLLDVVEQLRRAAGWPIVEPAHMELAEPSMGTAMDRCVKQGARLIVIHPYFLGPGRHWEEDIPRLAAEAARGHANLRYLVTAPLGPHPMMSRIMQDRIEQALARQVATGEHGARRGHLLNDPLRDV